MAVRSSGLKAGLIAGVAVVGILAFGVAGYRFVTGRDLGVFPASGEQLVVGASDIGGRVASSAGPEAGVWVIAETTGLPTVFRKIVVTDDDGRFLVPDLPKAGYTIWVRGYGLVDSRPVVAERGKRIDLQATVAPTAQAAAQIYPANYWMSLVRPPSPASFPEPTPRRLAAVGGAAPELLDVARTQTEFLYEMTLCSGCHQVGTKATRELNPALGRFASNEAAWNHRISIGPAALLMNRAFSKFPRETAVRMYADWTTRIQKGEVPKAPPRPQGIERNVVLTQWGWGTGPSDWHHDEISTDKRNPAINAQGPVYGAGNGSGSLTVLDLKTNRTQAIKMPLAVPEEKMNEHLVDYSGVKSAQVFPSVLWGNSPLWTAKTIPHNPMMDEQGRVWVTSRIRPIFSNPAFCSDPQNRYAKDLPLKASERQLTVYDPRTGKWQLIDTCFSTHHLQFAKDNTLYFSGTDGAVGWLDTRLYDKTHDSQKSQGWCAVHAGIDDNGRSDPKQRRRLGSRAYGLAISPADGSVWWAAPGMPGHIVRFVKGANPPETCSVEVYEPPFGKDIAEAKLGYGPKGIDVGPDGVVWTTLLSGQFASFDRRKCPSTNAIGQGCKAGWTLYTVPGPSIGATQTSAERMYYNWSDEFDTLGIGKNTQIATGSNSDSLLVLPPDRSKFLVFRVPYPLGFMTRGLDGRIDDPKAGWKGRGVWATQGVIPIWHTEGNMMAKPILVRFQVRPSPLAR